MKFFSQEKPRVEQDPKLEMGPSAQRIQDLFEYMYNDFQGLKHNAEIGKFPVVNENSGGVLDSYSANYFVEISDILERAKKYDKENVINPYMANTINLFMRFRPENRIVPSYQEMMDELAGIKPDKKEREENEKKREELIETFKKAFEDLERFKDSFPKQEGIIGALNNMDREKEEEREEKSN